MVLEQAKNLVSQYGADGLRTLDSIQLSTAISLSKVVDVFFTSDSLLKLLMGKEGLRTQLSEL